MSTRVGRADVDQGAVEGEVAARDLLRGCGSARPDAGAALEHLVAVALAGDLDLLGELISSSRVSSGISPICVRYMRTGSSIFSVEMGRFEGAVLLASSIVLDGGSSPLDEPGLGARGDFASSPSRTSICSRSSVWRMRSIIAGHGACSGSAVLSSSYVRYPRCAAGGDQGLTISGSVSSSGLGGTKGSTLRVIQNASVKVSSK